MIADDYYQGVKQMKITKSRLKEIIKEEVEKVLKEGLEDSEAGSRHYQNVKRKERILKKAIKDGLTFDQVQDKYTEFYDLDPEYYKHLKTEKPSEALEEEVDETMDSGYLSEPKNKKDEDK
jgi:division protein CdvB (Snf7/Vps24/ESCRT-III family)